MICKKCQCEFPKSVIIDGKRRMLNKRSYCLDCSPFGEDNKKHLSTNDNESKTKVCGKCKKKLPHSNYTKSGNGLYSYCRVCMNTRAKELNKSVKQKCIEYKGGKCVKCGYNKCPLALEFHHIDPTTKDFNINGRKSFNQNVKNELDKCILLCSNCHREIHYETFENKHL